ncbi:MAG: hypothetical protein N3A54_06810 [Patescibacteria group bacterium]|nr:hypothetical protein [Patescibacteria group bacterium]
MNQGQNRSRLYIRAGSWRYTIGVEERSAGNVVAEEDVLGLWIVFNHCGDQFYTINKPCGPSARIVEREYALEAAFPMPCLGVAWLNDKNAVRMQIPMGDITVDQALDLFGDESEDQSPKIYPFPLWAIFDFDQIDQPAFFLSFVQSPDMFGSSPLIWDLYRGMPICGLICARSREIIEMREFKQHMIAENVMNLVTLICSAARLKQSAFSSDIRGFISEVNRGIETLFRLTSDSDT